MRNILLRVIPIVGLVASAILLVDYINPSMMFCDSGGGCDIVKQSRFAHLLGIPTPAFGVAFFSAALALSLIPNRKARSLLVGMTGLGLGAGVGFIAIQTFVLHAFCKFCLVVDGSAILLFAAAFATRNLEDDLTVATRLGFAVVGGLALAAPFGVRALNPPVVNADPIVEGPTPDLIIKEQHQGVATIVEFVDFECPYCRRLHHTIEALAKEYGPKLRLVRKEHPLTSMHPHAMTAARAECCAEEFDKGDQMAEELYAAPVEELTREGCEKIAVKLGIDAESWRACLKSDKPNDKIISDQKDAAAAGVGEEAPVFWIGKKRYLGAQPSDVIKDGIDRALAM
jgi:predicted DsbA family dithiol-disulfide isomerase/uncharacterized membrane protein